MKIDDVARLYNCSVAKIRIHLKDGKIPARKIGRDWVFNLHELPKTIPATDNRATALVLNDGTEPLEAGDVVIDPMTKAKIEKEQAQAALKVIELKKEVGELTSASEVQAAAFKVGRQVRDLILSIPQKLAAEIACETDPHKCELLLARELKEALRVLTGNEVLNG